MGSLKELTIADRVFLALNLLAIVVGVALMILNGPSGPLIFLVLGAVGLALKKLPASLFGPDKPQA